MQFQLLQVFNRNFNLTVETSNQNHGVQKETVPVKLKKRLNVKHIHLSSP